MRWSWIGCWVLLCLLPISGRAQPAPADQPGNHAPLSRGINITGWFRYPASRDPTVLARYLSDQAIRDLRKAGFDFVRLAVDPDVVDSTETRAVLIAAIRRIQREGLTVVVSPHPVSWHLETDPGDRGRLLEFWRSLGPDLGSLDAERTVPEVLNEPVFPGDPVAWASLQHAALSEIRQALPTVTVMLTGQDWGSIGGLTALAPEADANVVYSFHFYDPSELTSLAAYRPGLDRAALARLPFPVDASCQDIAGQSADVGTRGLMQYYCSLGWDAGRIEASIERAAAWGRLHGVQLVAGEFGASAQLNPVARMAWLQTLRTTLDAHGIGWALWGYDDIMGLAVSCPPGPRPTLDPAVLTALNMTTRM